MTISSFLWLPVRVQVWLLAGGDAAGADQSIAAARHLALQLGQCSDLQVRKNGENEKK